MKQLYNYIQEMEGCATPSNVMGMGNPMPPTDTQPGSEPVIPTAKVKKEKKKRKI